MSVSKAWYIQCDICGDPAPVAVGSPAQAAVYARQEGFTCTRGNNAKDICPRCRTDKNAAAVGLAIEKQRPVKRVIKG